MRTLLPTATPIPILPPRQLGERCCDPAAKPSLKARDAARLSADMDTLGHPVRLQILNVLARAGGRVCVCDLEAAVPVKQPTVSHHLRILRRAGLVDSEKQGLWVYYFVRRQPLEALRGRIAGGLEAIG